MKTQTRRRIAVMLGLFLLFGTIPGGMPRQVLAEDTAKQESAAEQRSLPENCSRNGDGTIQFTDSLLGSAKIAEEVLWKGNIFRMYNPNTGEHTYTKNPAEAGKNVEDGWNHEADGDMTAFGAETEGTAPVYRVYNPNSGLHHYTMDRNEVKNLTGLGWSFEGAVFWAMPRMAAVGVPMWRLYNPNNGQHFWTASKGEYDVRCSEGWQGEGEAWNVCEDGGTTEETSHTRTIMLYPVGSNLESNFGSLTKNLHMVMNAGVPENVTFLVTTTGACRWFMEEEYLVDGEGNPAAIDLEKKQIWRITGSTADHTAKMTLVGEIPVEDKYSVMDAECLTSFIDYCKDGYPSDKYDLILWDHGYGPMGFGQDFAPDWNPEITSFSIGEIARGIRENSMDDRFEMINFDACLMSSAEVILTLSDYAEYFVVSEVPEPGDGEDYVWIKTLGKEPSVSGFTLGKEIVDAYVAYCENEPGLSVRDAVMTVIDTDRFMESMPKALAELSGELTSEAVTAGEDGIYGYYDELLSSQISFGADTGFSLTDLGMFAENLGIAVTEETGRDRQENNYTKAAAEVKKVLSDETIMYTGSTKAIKRNVDFGKQRNGNGDVGDMKKMIPTGMNLFFPNGNTVNVVDYIGAVDGMLSAITAAGGKESEERYIALKELQKAAVCYEMIYQTGIAVSEEMENGNAAPSYADVQARWKADDPAIMAAYRRQGYSEESMPDKSRWDHALKEVYKKLAELLGGEAAADKWLSALVAQQSSEAILSRNADTEVAEGLRRFTLNNTLPKVLYARNPLKENLFIIPEGEESAMSLGTISGRMEGAGEKQVSLAVWEVTDGWYEFIDSEGKGHLASVDQDEFDPDIYYIPVRMEKPGDASNNYFDSTWSGVLCLRRLENGFHVYACREWSDTAEEDFIPENFEGYTMYMAVMKSGMDYAKIFSDSGIRITDPALYSLQENVPFTEIDDLTDSVKNSLSKSFSLKDIYGVKHSLRTTDF